ncbi:M20 family metallopeptidase [Olsenella massiliensis]|uniref:M20 family metallopeptidase n=1 Tax=Olsenella massiliensis TaxID=1622075 RepID=UPI00071C3489|nr:M20 family metallopeptidase [Olsenella massiliensis]
MTADGLARRRREVEVLTSELVRIDSTNPGAGEGRLAAFVSSWLGDRIGRANAGGARRATLERLEALPDRPCLRATILAPGDEDARRPHPADLSLLCHMDTVRVGEGWSEKTGPFSARREAGRLYGRGSCDMKGGLACALLAFSDVLDDVMAGAAARRSLSLVCTCDEEDVMRGVEAAIDAGWFSAEGWVLDTEPTDGLIRAAHKGRSWFKVRVEGTTAHASTPWLGADAIAGMAEAIGRLRRTFRDLPADADLGPSTVTFGQIEGGYAPYVVPDACSCTIDMRLVPPLSTAWARGVVQDALDAAQDAVRGVRGSYVVTGDRPPIAANPRSGLLKALRAACARTGHPTGTDVFTGYTDSAVVAGTLGNVECLSYGPGSLDLAHKPNEYVAVRDLWRVRDVLSDLARTTCGTLP